MALTRYRRLSAMVQLALISVMYIHLVQSISTPNTTQLDPKPAAYDPQPQAGSAGIQSSQPFGGNHLGHQLERRLFGITFQPKEPKYYRAITARGRNFLSTLSTRKLERAIALSPFVSKFALADNGWSTVHHLLTLSPTDLTESMLKKMGVEPGRYGYASTYDSAQNKAGRTRITYGSIPPGQNYTASEGRIKSFVDCEEAVLVSEEYVAPKTSAPLRQWADLVWLHYVQGCNDRVNLRDSLQPPPLKWIARLGLDTEDNELNQIVLDFTRYRGHTRILPYWPGLVYQRNDWRLAALLGTRWGVDVTILLGSHRLHITPPDDPDRRWIGEDEAWQFEIKRVHLFRTEDHAINFAWRLQPYKSVIDEIINAYDPRIDWY